MKTLHFIPLVKTFRLRSTCEVAACRRVDVFLIKGAPAVLTRRQAALILPHRRFGAKDYLTVTDFYGQAVRQGVRFCP